MVPAWALWAACPDPCRCQVVLVELVELLEPMLELVLAPPVQAQVRVQAALEACQAVWVVWEEWEAWAA